jgi:hypothetical protein
MGSPFGFLVALSLITGSSTPSAPTQPRLLGRDVVVLVHPLEPSDTTAGPLVIHVRVGPEAPYSGVDCVIEVTSDSVDVSNARGKLEVERGPARALVLWGNLAPERLDQKRNTVRFVFGLQRDLLEGGKFYLQVPWPKVDLNYSWVIDLARYRIRDR